MNSIHRARKVIVITFLLSLLFHTSSILYMVLQKTQRDVLIPPPDLHSLEQEVKKNDPWAETKARASNFGAPVLFQDEPTHNDQFNQEESPQLDEEIYNQQSTFSEAVPVHMVALSQEPSETANITKGTITQNLKQQSSQQKKTIPTTSQSHQGIALKKTPLSLAQLTQGFLNHVKNEGNHTLSMIGKKNSLPSDEQIKHERYLQKLSWCLQNSFSINNHRFPQSATTELTLHVFLALNRDGTMKHVRVSKSSGNMHLDNFTLFIFNDASSSFPPVPNYLPYDPFTITYVITVNAIDQDSIRIYRR